METNDATSTQYSPAAVQCSPAQAPPASPESSPSPSCDETLVNAALSGNPRAFELLVERYFAMVHAIAYARLGHRESAEDLAQEVFHRAFLHLNRLREPRRFGPWIATIARNLAANWKRNGQTRSKLIPMLPLEELPRELADRLSENARRRLEEKEERGALHEALDRLPPEQRELVLLHFAEGWTLNDIAARMGIHSTTVGRRIDKALRHMRQFLEPILRETAPRLAARTDARIHAVGLIAATSALTESSRAVLAAAAAKGLASLGAGAAVGAATAAATTPWGKLWLFLMMKLAAPWGWFQNLGIVQKIAVTVTSFVLVVGGGGAAVYHEVTKPTRDLYFDRLQSAVFELYDAGGGNVAIRRVWPEDGTPRAKFQLQNIQTEQVKDSFIIRAQVPRGYTDPMPIAYLMRSNPMGGYDLAGQVAGWQETEDIVKYREDRLASWRRGDSLREGAVSMAWLPLPDADTIDALKTWEEDRAATERILDRLLRKRPGLALYQLLRLDAAIAAQDEAKVAQLLDRFAPDLRKSGDEFLAAAPEYYRMWLWAMEAERHDRNLWTRVHGDSGDPKTDALKTDWRQQLQIVTGVHYDDAYLNPKRGLILHNEFGVTKFLDLQVASKNFRVLGNFRLFQGDPGGALALTLPFHRIGTIMTAKSIHIIDRLIGVAIRAISVEGVRLAFLDGMGSAEEIQRFWPLLEEAYLADLDAARNHLNPEMDTILFRTAPIDSDANFAEARIRNFVSHCRIATLHTAVAARYRWMTTGQFPTSDVEYEPLLSRPDSDPFPDFRLPLRVRHVNGGPFLVYSVGPDGQDQGGGVDYDPTNGTVSAGDIVVEVPRERKYPFPPPGQLATTRDGILAQFPNGLPPDPFADRRYSSYAITDTNPAWILSWGADTDQKAGFQGPDRLNVSGAYPGSHLEPGSLGSQPPLAQAIPINPDLPRTGEPSARIPPRGYGVSTYLGEYFAYPNLQPGLAYDPTNGTVSTGNLFFRTDLPHSTMLDGNLPPTPTP